MFEVVIADDHRLLLEGLVSALEALPDVTVLATAADGAELLSVMEQHDPDVVLVDLEMPNLGGLAALGSIADSTPCIVVTMHTGSEQRERARRAGAKGFMSKATPLPDLAAAIRAVADDQSLFDHDPVDELLDQYRQPVLDSGAAALTKRERELLGLLASGVSTTEDLADRLFISQKTVKNHLASVYDKLAISDRAQAAVEAIRLGLHRSDRK